MKMLPVFLVSIALAASPAFAQKPDAKPEKKPPGATTPAVAGEPKNVTPDEAEKLVKDGKVTVLDVRTPEEFEDGHIAGAVNLNVHDAEFSAKLAELDKAKPILLHCAAGNRSVRALPVLREQKFPTVYHLNGGLKAWLQAGKPTVEEPVVEVPKPAK